MIANHLRCAAVLGALTLLLLSQSATPSRGRDRAFDVVAPDKVPFNYPEPPREGPPDYFTMAQGGQARCVIVQPANASKAVQRAATALETYLGLATGGRFSVVAEGGAIARGMAAIHVGDTSVARKTKLDLPELRYGDEVLPNLDGYLIQTVDPHTLVIRGCNDAATLHAVVGFLKRYVGIRQYWLGAPGNLGDVIPSRPTLRIPKLLWRDWPYFFSRAIVTHPFLAPSGLILDFFRRHETLPCSENYDTWLPPKKYGQEHPEYFGLVQGKRRVPAAEAADAGWQPCVSNPEVRRIMSAAAVDYFRAHPDAVGINFSLNDGGGDCTCPACQALDAPRTDYSRQVGIGDRYVKLTNEVCQCVRRQYPDKLIVYLAYNASRQPPQAVAPDRSLLPVLTTPGNAFEAWDDWLATGVQHMGLYVHHDDAFFILPKFDLRQAVKRIRYIVASGRARVYYTEMHNSWPFNDILAYVTAELLWDPRQDVRTILDEYYTSFYGPAAEPMREFQRTLDAGYERWLQEEGQPHPFGKDRSSITHARAWEQFRVLNAEEADRAAAALSQAAEAAHGHTQVAQRIEIIRGMFRLQEMAAKQYWTAMRLKDGQVRSRSDAQRVVDDARAIFALGHRMSDYIRDVLEKPPLDAYAFFRHSRRKLDLYEELKAGQASPESQIAVTAGVDAAAAFLRKSLGPQKAAAWWRHACETEKEPALSAAFATAELRSKGLELKNLVADPGFEEIGQKLAPNEFALNRDIVLRPEQEKALGIMQWFPERSPYKCVLTSQGVHGGRYALLIEHCHRARVSRLTPAAAGDRFRVSLWFKHNEGQAAYAFAVDASVEGGTYPKLASLPIPQKPGQWQELAVEVVAPPNSKFVSLRLYVETQAADAACWLDDLFIGRYPK